MLYGMNYYTKDEIDSLHWQLAGRVQQSSTTSVTIDLPTANPWGIKVYASCESESDTWCDLRALDSSGNNIEYNRSYVENYAGTVSGLNFSGTGQVPFAVIPADTHHNGVCEAISVRSASGNYRSFVFNSHGDSIDWSGGSTQKNNTSVAKIQLKTGSTANLYLEVWVLYR